MATVNRDGAGYMVRYRTPAGTQTKKRGFKTKREAELFAATVEVAKATGDYVSPTLGKATVEDLAGPWLERKVATTAASHSRMLVSAWKIHVRPRWGRASIASIDLLGVESWVAEMTRAGATPTTVLRAYGVLAGVLDDAVKSRRLSSNPARGVDNLPRKTARRHVYLTGDDVTALAEASGKHSALVLTLAYCGVRWGEAIALKVRDVEFLRRRISVHANAVQLGVDHAVGPTKGREARSVPVPGFVLDELARQCRGKSSEDLVFPGPGGGYLPRPKSGRGWFAIAVERSGVQSITAHDLRHTCASLAVSAGANVLAISRMLGHKDPSVTLKVYADLFDSDLDAVAAALHSRYGAAPMTAEGR